MAKAKTQPEQSAKPQRGAQETDRNQDSNRRTATVKARTFRTSIDLSPDVRNNVVTLLNARLADSLDLYSQMKQAHWNVKGMDFIQLHELFDEIAERTLEYVDNIAERATELGGYATGTARMAAASSSLPEYPTEATEGREHLEAVVERMALYAKNIREGIDQADDLEDKDTADLFTEISRAVDKDLWFLEAHLQA
jgi:starvation-inducible DNA-binding protein